jgi:hypothetical protein
LTPIPIGRRVGVSGAPTPAVLAMTGLTGLQPSRAFTRRSLLLAGAGAAATAAIPKMAVAAAKEASRPTHLDRSSWQPFVGTILETRNQASPRVPLLLVRIGDPATSYGQSEAFRERTFVLVFRGPDGQPLAEATHRVMLTGIGVVDVWFSGAHETDQGWEYVAVFSNSRVRQRAPKKPRASRGQRAQARERSRKAERIARRKRRAQRKRDREREREEAGAQQAAERGERIG